MDITYNSGAVILQNAEDFDADKIFDCGQCFRWEKKGDAWDGIAMGRKLSLLQDGACVRLFCGTDDFENVWRRYFDLDRDYALVRQSLSTDPYMKKACDFGKGIRILRQEPWEALCTFIISQCNNIPRIKGIVERLCSLFGEEIGEGEHAFPTPERIARLEVETLAPLRAGYRASYIISAARAVDAGELDLDALASGSADDAQRALLNMPGIGKKVAGCVMLFGLGMLEAFPVDTWMKKALKTYFEPGFDPAVFAGNAGIAQQYIFYYSRWGDSLSAEKTAGKCE